MPEPLPDDPNVSILRGMINASVVTKAYLDEEVIREDPIAAYFLSRDKGLIERAVDDICEKNQKLDRERVLRSMTSLEECALSVYKVSWELHSGKLNKFTPLSDPEVFNRYMQFLSSYGSSLHVYQRDSEHEKTFILSANEIDSAGKTEVGSFKLSSRKLIEAKAWPDTVLLVRQQEYKAGKGIKEFSLNHDVVEVATYYDNLFSWHVKPVDRDATRIVFGDMLNTWIKQIEGLQDVLEGIYTNLNNAKTLTYPEPATQPALPEEQGAQNDIDFSDIDDVLSMLNDSEERIEDGLGITSEDLESEDIEI